MSNARPRRTCTQLPLHERIDRAVAVETRIDEDEDRPIIVFSLITGPRGEAIELRIEPSRLLYEVDREAYVEVLKTVEPSMMESETGKEPDVVATEGVAIDTPGSSIGPAEGPVVKLQIDYKGELLTLRKGFEAFLGAEGVNPATAGEGGVRLIDSLLATAEQNMALDWKQRDTVQAKLKVSCKRVLVRFGCAAEQADAVADRLVSWLRVQAPDSITTRLHRPDLEKGSRHEHSLYRIHRRICCPRLARVCWLEHCSRIRDRA